MTKGVMRDCLARRLPHQNLVASALAIPKKFNQEKQQCSIVSNKRSVEPLN
jgi:hypothetical protein